MKSGPGIRPSVGIGLGALILGTLVVLAVDLDPRSRQLTVFASAAWPIGVTLTTVSLVAAIVALERSRRRILVHQATSRESEESFRSLYESMTDIVVVATPDGRILHANGAARQRLGYDAAEMAAMHLLDWHPAERRAEAETIFGELLRGERETCPLPLVARDGSLIPVQTQVWRGGWNGAECVFGISKLLSPARELQQLVESTFHRNPSPMALTDLSDHRYVDVNEAFLEASGFGRDEIIGRTTAELGLFAHPGEGESVRDRLRSGEPVSNTELRVRRKDGSFRDGLFSGELIASHGHRYLLTLMLDITERKRAEVALRKSEEEHRLLVENSHDIIYTLASDGSLTYVSPAWTVLLGHPVSEVTGRPLTSFLHPDDLPAYLAFLEVLFEKGRRQDGVEYRVRHLDRSWRWHTSSAVPIVEEADGEVTGLYGIARDITGQKRQHEALERRMVALTRPPSDAADIAFEDLFSLPDLQRLQEEFAEATGVASLITQTDGTPITAPSGFCRLCDMIRSTEKGLANCFRSDAELGCFRPGGPTILPCLSGGLWEAGAAVSVGGRHIASWLVGQVRDETQTEEQIRRYAREIGADEDALAEAFREVPGMSRERFESVARALFTLANLLSNIAFQNVQQARFITERERMEAERERLTAAVDQAQKMESVGRLAGGVAHDFNNIMTTMQLQLDLLLEDRPLEPGLQAGLTELVEQVHRAAGLTRQLLLFSRQTAIQLVPLDLNGVVANLLRMLRRLLGENVDVRFHANAAEPRVKADPGMMEQVVMNLSVNARDAMPEGGRLTFVTDTVSVGAEEAREHPDARPGSFVRLTVTDTGVGMDEATRQRIFEPFFTTKAVGKGTGLGLATIYGIVSRHGGWIEVSSRIGRGTEFRVFLPALENEGAGSAIEPKAPSVPSGDETLLLVEDDTDVRRITARYLRTRGYRVLESKTGREAIAIWGKHEGGIDLVYSDMVLPDGMSGLELVKLLCQERPGLPVVLSSGYSSELSQPDELAARGIAFVPKPSQPADIARSIRSSLDRAAAISR